MIGRSTDWLLGISAGLLLALMLNYNSLLAKHTTPVFSSWVAHGLGAVTSLVLVALATRVARPVSPEAPRRAKVPLWFYLGGVPGTFTVILGAITVNGGLSLSGTIAFMLLGQVLFGLVSDSLGLFRTPKRRIGTTDFFVAFCVLTGSALIIFGRA